MANRSIASVRQKIRSMGSYIDFDANGEFITTSSSAAPSTSGFNMSFWMIWRKNRRVFTDQERIIAFTDAGPTNGILFFRNNSTEQFRLQIFNSGTAQTDITCSIVPNVWTHITITYAPNNAKLYVNGVLAGSDTSVTMTAMTALRICAATNWFGGGIDELVIHNTTTPWTQTEIDNVYSKSIYPTGTNLIYKLDEGSGTTANDSSGNGYSGTITNASYVTSDLYFSNSRSAVSNRFLIPSSSQKSIFHNGSTAFTTVPVTPSTTGFNIAVWAQLNTLRSNGGVIQRNTSTTHGFKIMYESGKLQVILYDSSATATITANPNTPALGVWSHIAVTFAPNNLTVYVNGVSIGTDVSCTMGDATGKTLTLSRNNDVGSGYINSRMCFLTFQNTATPWTQQQITDLYWRNMIPSGATQWSMNNTNLDQNGANGLTLTNTSYSTDVPEHMAVRTVI